MIKSSSVVITLMALWNSGTAQALGPAEFDARVSLQTPVKATWYRFNLPLNLQFRAHDADLRDLRVFNGEGEPVPYSLTLSSAQQRDVARETELRRFPLYGGPEDAEPQPGVRVRSNSDGTLIEIASNRRTEKPTQLLRGWLLDASAVTGPLDRLVLDWSNGQEGFQQVSIDVSDDLQRWSYCCDGQLARVSFNGERIEQRTIDLSRRSARYLRLLWSEPKMAPVLTVSTMISSRREVGPIPMAWSDPLTGVAGKEGEWLWHLPLALPLERLRLEPLPENTLAPLQVQGRREDGLPWSPLGQGIVYRLGVQGRPMEQYEVALSSMAVKELKLKVDTRGGGLGPNAPRLAVGLTANQVVFLARGTPPFILALGHDRLDSAALPLGTLMPGGLTRDATAIAEAQMDMSTVQYSAAGTVATPGSSSDATEPDWKRVTLWSVLLVGIGLLGAMVWQLIRKTRNESP